MHISFVGVALLMGLVGGPHCAMMCGAPCAGITRLIDPGGLSPVMRFQLGRIVGYSAAGAAVATLMDNLTWVSTQFSVVRPLWTLSHAAILVWGLMLLAQARQPQWAQAWGAGLWSCARPLARRFNAPLLVGVFWALLPCGLLYSALQAAALSGDWLDGAFFMALFAAGSSVSLQLMPFILHRLHGLPPFLRQDWGVRLSGFLLMAMSWSALRVDLMPGLAKWCGI